MVGRVILIDLVNYEIEQRMEEDGTMSDENWKYVEALRNAVNHFFKDFGYFYWSNATVEIQQPKEADHGQTEYAFILTSKSPKWEPRYMAFYI